MNNDDTGLFRENFAASQKNGVRDYRAEQAKFEAEIDALPDYTLRAQCRCGSSRGKGPRDVSGQAMIYCAECRRHAYNAPKHETGRGVRQVRSRPDLGFGQRERVLEREGGVCFLCKRSDGILHVAHALSVKDALEMGIHEEVYMDDANLYAACEECNLGLGARSMEARTFLALIQSRLRNGKKPR